MDSSALRTQNPLRRPNPRLTPTNPPGLTHRRPDSLLESPEWMGDEPAFLVDYRLELHGIRSSGGLISHLVTETGVKSPVEVIRPTDPELGVTLPALSQDAVDRLSKTSKPAARREAEDRFEEFKVEHAALVEQEVERLLRMFDSRRGLLTDRVARNDRQIHRLERFGTDREKRIVPALRGQIRADRTRLHELDGEQVARLDAVHAARPEQYLRLLGVTMIVRPGRLKEMAS